MCHRPRYFAALADDLLSLQLGLLGCSLQDGFSKIELLISLANLSAQVRYGHRQKGWYTKKGKDTAEQSVPELLEFRITPEEEIACLLDKFGKRLLSISACHSPI